MVGTLGNSVVNNTGLNLPAMGNIPAAALLGATPVDSLVSPLSSVPAIAGLPGGGLQIPTPAIPSIDTIGVPSECLLLRNMFDPKDEVARLHLYLESFCRTFVVSNDIILLAWCAAEGTGF